MPDALPPGALQGNPFERLRMHAELRHGGSGGEDAGDGAEREGGLAGALRTYEEQLGALRDALRQSVLDGLAALTATPNQWTSIGPAVVYDGQAVGEPACSGRVAGLSVSPTHDRVFAASAIGGVWRSDHAGRHWRSTMEFDFDPQGHRSTSLACGAILVDSTDPDLVFVGTGEGLPGLFTFFGSASRSETQFGGLGPLVSRTGGERQGSTPAWRREPVNPANSLDGHGFYNLVQHPANREAVAAGTSNGVYVRRQDAGSNPATYTWHRVSTRAVTSLAVTSDGTTTRLYTVHYPGQTGDAQSGQVLTATWTAAGVVSAWTTLGTGFLTGVAAGGIGRISLATRPGDATIVYALVSDNNGGLQGLWRYDTSVDTTWRQVQVWHNTAANAPLDVFSGQGLYDQGLAIDPRNPNRVYIGGGSRGYTDPRPGIGLMYGAGLDRWLITSTGTGAATTFQLTQANHASIGAGVHGDIHALVVDPNNSRRLWVGCDGGVFVSNNATSPNPTFEPLNTGLDTLTLTDLAQHPASDAMALAGAQDCGALRYTGDEVWYHTSYGDGGASVINQRTPHQMASIYTYNDLRSTTDGGQDNYGTPGSWGMARPYPTLGANSNARAAYQRARSLFYPPVEGVENPQTNAQATMLFFGGRQLFVSPDFGANWTPTGAATGATSNSGPFLRCLATRAVSNSQIVVYAGWTNGRIYQYLQSGAGWTETRIDNAGGLGIGTRAVTDIAIDPGNTNRVYITVGGAPGLANRVWFYDGAAWHGRSGPATPQASRLYDVVHEAIVCDPNNGQRVYAGSDVGVFRSTDGGRSWAPYSVGLPETVVKDLRIHGPRRLLRASLHGRGAWEILLDATTVPPVELYLRSHALDSGRVTPVQDVGSDPTVAATTTVAVGSSPDIKVDAPSASGAYRTPTENIDCLQFVDDLGAGDSDTVATVARADGLAVNRVFVQVHNRGPQAADGVRVTALLAERTGGTLPALPADFAARIRAGQAVNTGGWTTLGSETMEGLRSGLPQIAGFELKSTELPTPSGLSGHDRWAVLVVLHDDADPFNDPQTDPVALCRNNRRVAIEHLRVRGFTGQLPAPSQRGWVRLQPETGNWCLSAGPPTFQVHAEENGRAVIELAYDPQALLAPSIGYDDGDALRYFSTDFGREHPVFDKTIRKADGSAHRVRLRQQTLTTVDRSLSWTIPAALWEGYQAEAEKHRADASSTGWTGSLYYRVRFLPVGAHRSATPALWPSDAAIHNNPDAPHLGLLPPAPATGAPAFPDLPALQGMSEPWFAMIVLWVWSQQQSSVTRNSLVAVLNHGTFQTQLSVADRGRMLHLWVIAGASARLRLPALLERRVWTSNTEDAPAVLRKDKHGRLDLIDNLIQLLAIAPHPDLRTLITGEQLVDDVLTEILDPNGQANRSDAATHAVTAMQGLLMQVNPAEYVRLQRGWLSRSGSATLAGGAVTRVPPNLYRLVGRATGGAGAPPLRTFSELAFQGAMMRFALGPLFVHYDPADSGWYQMLLQAIWDTGPSAEQVDSALDAVFGRQFRFRTTSATAGNLRSKLQERRVPILAALSWGSGHRYVLLLREENGRVFFKNTAYAGSSPPAGHTRGSTQANPTRRVDDPTQCLESVPTSALNGLVERFHYPEDGSLLQ